ncbi:hypothetical protein MRB53_023423 [Persea americana]|uniref:Uncharacterized protein n=1 Tax=Persea americana TaxID=3435 RepID=A0ACC2L9R8_PERAE|nr:hypothetical protein MRB53_023423 [Persea americana]
MRIKQGYPKALPYKSYTIDYNKLTICFGKNVATGQYARSATTAPSRQSTESGAANFTPLQPDSVVGLTDQLGGVRIQSSSIEAFSRRMNARKRNSELMKIIHCIERSPEGLTAAIRDVADTIRLPKRGRQPGIYQTWTECKEQVLGYPNAEFKGFGSIEEARVSLLNYNGQAKLIPEPAMAMRERLIDIEVGDEDSS